VALTARRLNRATLHRQLLLQRQPMGAADAIRRVVALQAQAKASPYIALWNRVARFDPAELDAAFAAGVAVKAQLMRVTVHVVHADDYTSMRAAMQPTLRGARLHDRRFRASGLTLADADALLPGLVEFARRPRTAAAFEAWLDDRVGPAARVGVWWAMRQYAPLLHVPADTTWSFADERSYVAPVRMPDLTDGAADRELQQLVRRYLEGFGPASVADVAQFALVERARARRAVDAMAGDLERLSGPAGEALFDLPDASRPSEDMPAPPRLLPMWDNTLLAFADRSRVIPEELRRVVIRSNGDVLPTMLVDGYVAGVWRAVDDGIEALAFTRLDESTWASIEQEARSLLTLLTGRDPRPYRRYDHWWSKLPDGHTRLLRAT
jgi:hypothetical protein